MITGIVNSQCEVVLALRVRGMAGSEILVEAVLDTGFTDTLTLSQSDIARLGLQSSNTRLAALADGSVHNIDLYPASVEWDGTWRNILVYGLGDETLVGMRMIAGHSVRFDAVSGGVLEMVALP